MHFKNASTITSTTSMTLYVFLNWYFWPSSHYTILLLERIKHNSNWKRLSYNCQISKLYKVALKCLLNEAFLLSWNIFIIACEFIPGLVIESCNAVQTCLQFSFGKTNAITYLEKIRREKCFYCEPYLFNMHEWFSTSWFRNNTFDPWHKWWNLLKK